MLISNLYNFTAVWLIDRNAAVAHDEKTFFIVDLKEGNTSLVVDGCQMLSVREDRDVLRVITADRETVPGMGNGTAEPGGDDSGKHGSRSAGGHWPHAGGPGTGGN